MYYDKQRLEVEVVHIGQDVQEGSLRTRCWTWHPIAGGNVQTGRMVGERTWGMSSVWSRTQRMLVWLGHQERGERSVGSNVMQGPMAMCLKVRGRVWDFLLRVRRGHWVPKVGMVWFWFYRDAVASGGRTDWTGAEEKSGGPACSGVSLDPAVTVEVSAGGWALVAEKRGKISATTQVFSCNKTTWHWMLHRDFVCGCPCQLMSSLHLSQISAEALSNRSGS